MKRAKDICILLIMIALVARVLWWTLEPMLPMLGGLLLIIMILGYIYYRTLKW